MKLLVCHPGATFSTADVYTGYWDALLAQGHTLYPYQLDVRIERAGSWLQHLWRKAGKPDPRPTPADVLYRAGLEALERALRWGVDGVLVISAMYLHPDVLILMRRAGLRTGVVFTESPYDDAQQVKVAQYVDVCWTNERSSVSFLRQANPNVYYLPHAHDPSRHTPSKLRIVGGSTFEDEQPDVPKHDVVFVGTPFKERIELLSKVDWDGIDLGLYGTWHTISSRSRLRKYIAGGTVDNTKTAALYRGAKIGLNLYRQSVGFGPRAPRITHAESLNPRAYELAACGVFQISDYRAELTEVFGDAVPTFETAAQLGALVRRYLTTEEQRRESALLSRQAVVPHTFAARAAQLTAQLQEAWEEPLAKGA